MLRGLKALVAVLGLVLGSQALAQTATFIDLAKESTATTGTGASLVVSGAVSGFLTIEAAATQAGKSINGATVHYGITDGSNRESGPGTYDAGTNTLTRCTSGVNCTSTNSGNRIDLSGSAQVGITAIARSFDDLATAIAATDLDYTDDAGTAGLAITESETLTFAGDSGGIDTSGSGNTLTISFDPAEAETGLEAVLDKDDLQGNLTLAGDVDGAHGANDIDEAAVEIEIEGVLDLADLQTKVIDNLTDVTITSLADNEILTSSGGVWINQTWGEVEAQIEAVVDAADLQGDITLTTDTAGDYVATVADGTGIDGTATGEGSTYTPTFDATELTGTTTFGAGAAVVAAADFSASDDVLIADDIDFGAGDVQIAYSANDLAFTGVTGDYSFDDTVFVTGTVDASDDLDAGDDVLIADDISFGGGDVLIEYAANDLSFSGVTGDYSFDDTVGITGSLTASVDVTATSGDVTAGDDLIATDDVLLSDSGVVNFGAGDCTLTDGTDLLTIAGCLVTLDLSDNQVAQADIADDAVGNAELDFIDGDTPGDEDCITIETGGANGSLEAQACGGGSQTPWGADIDTAGFTLSNTGLTDTIVLDFEEDQLELTNDAADGTGVQIKAHHDSSSPADGDLAFDLLVHAGADDEEVGRIALEVDDGSTTTEDTRWRVFNDVAGSSVESLTMTGALASFAGSVTAATDLTATAGDVTAGDDLLGDDLFLTDGLVAIQVTGTDDGSVGPVWVFQHDSATPADGDLPLDLQVFAGADDEEVGRIALELDDGGTGSEDTQWRFFNDVAGTSAQQVAIGQGLIIGAGTTFPGAGDLRVTEVELGADSDTTIARSAAGEATIEGDAVKHAGRQTIPLAAGAGVQPAGGGIATCTGVAAFDSGTNDVFLRQCSFSAGTDNAIYFTFFFPKSAAESTDLVVQVDWTSATTTDTTDDVIWTAAAVCFSNDDSINANAFPAVDTVTDTQTAAGDYLVSGEITAITPAGSPAEGDGCVLRITRDADAGGDNFNGTAELIQVRLYYVDSASSDD